MADARRVGVAQPRTVVVRSVVVLFAVAALGTILTASPVYAASPLASATAIVNPPPQDGLLSLCITSHTLDPNGTCLTLGSRSPTAVTGTMTGRALFTKSPYTPVRLSFTGFNGSPGLATGFDYGEVLGYGVGYGGDQSLYSPDSFAYQATDGSGNCITGQDPQHTGGVPVRGINWFDGLDFEVGNGLRTNPATEPMWGQLPCTGTFAGHTGPFTINFAGTVTFSRVPDCPCPDEYGDFQGRWVVVFGS